jgi:hypothetical protein
VRPSAKLQDQQQQQQAEPEQPQAPQPQGGGGKGRKVGAAAALEGGSKGLIDTNPPRGELARCNRVVRSFVIPVVL